jgi:release factor glutamine methyltransferase
MEKAIEPVMKEPIEQAMEKVSGQELWQWWRWARTEAIAHQVPLAELDWFLQAVSDLDRLSLRLESFQARSMIPLHLPFGQVKDHWQARLIDRTPVQYLTGSTPWRNFMLQVSPAVLIPRPETECLIDLAIALTADRPELRRGAWVDLGTGSGAIALGLADVFEAAEIHAVDVSEAALAIARSNAASLQFDHRITFHQGQWFDPFDPEYSSDPKSSSLERVRTQNCKKFSGMVSNPPYIPRSMLSQLQPEVIDHEPSLALDGGEDGLDAIRVLSDRAPNYLVSGGVWLVEMMAGQAEAVVDLLEANGHYRDVRVYPDLAGIDRFGVAFRG